MVCCLGEPIHIVVPAIVELRWHFPGIVDNENARLCVRTIAGWQPLLNPRAGCLSSLKTAVELGLATASASRQRQVSCLYRRW